MKKGKDKKKGEVDTSLFYKRDFSANRNVVRRKDKNGRYYYIDKKTGKRSKKDVWYNTKQLIKHQKSTPKKPFKEGKKIRLEFHWSSGISRIKEALFENGYTLITTDGMSEKRITALESLNLFMFFDSVGNGIFDEARKLEKKEKRKGKKMNDEKYYFFIPLEFDNEKLIFTFDIYDFLDINDDNIEPYIDAIINLYNIYLK